MNTLTFADLKRGDTFDFVDDARPGMNSFYARCTKIDRRRYKWKDPKSGRVLNMAVGTVKVRVYNVERSK